MLKIFLSKQIIRGLTIEDVQKMLDNGKTFVCNDGDVVMITDEDADKPTRKDVK